MSNLTNWTDAHGSQSYGAHGAFGIRIQIAGDNLPDLNHRTVDLEDPLIKAAHYALYDAEDKVTDAIRTLIMAKNPEVQAAGAKERAELLALFPTPIYVEPLPNGYCSKWCCKHLPWFKVTTQVGHIKIGWRKRVINIDWTECPGSKTAEELFAGENVTKDVWSIHAYGYDRARTYIAAILSGTPIPIEVKTSLPAATKA